MSPVGMARVCVNTCPNTSSHSAGWIARVSNSVGSWRSLRTSSSAMTRVLVTNWSIPAHRVARAACTALAEALSGTSCPGGFTITLS